MDVKCTDKSSDKYLEINSVGIQTIHGTRCGSIRENGRLDHHILFVTEGYCEVYENGKPIRAEAGSIVYYPPHTR